MLKTMPEKAIYFGIFRYTKIYTPIVQMLEDAGGTSVPLCKSKKDDYIYRCDRVTRSNRDY